MKVSVIMAVYNGEKFIGDAIDSILKQTFTDFEFIIVNDGSTDSTRKIIERFNDPRLKIIHQSNQGCANARERAIASARGEYIAIIDADDIALPKRLEMTVNYLDNHPETVLVGTGFIVRNEANNLEETVIPHTEDTKLRCCLLRYDPFKDPTLLLRKAAFVAVGGYKVDHGFDYELYSRLAKVGKLENIEEVLLITRQHAHQFFRAGITPREHAIRRLKIRWLSLWRLKPSFILFIRTLIWLSFEYASHLIPKDFRNLVPEVFRSLLKQNLPPKV